MCRKKKNKVKVYLFKKTHKILKNVQKTAQQHLS